MEPEPVFSNHNNVGSSRDHDDDSRPAERLDKVASRSSDNSITKQQQPPPPLPFRSVGGGADPPPFLPPPRGGAKSPEEHLAIVLSLGKPVKQQQQPQEGKIRLHDKADRSARMMSYTHGLIQQTLQRQAKPVEQKVVLGLRQNMREELIKRLNKSNSTAATIIGRQSPEMQAAFAKRLEELLFKTSKSVEAYADSKTLDRRLQTLIDAMQKRKARKAKSAAATAAAAGPSSTSASTPRPIAQQFIAQQLLQRNLTKTTTTKAPPRPCAGGGISRPTKTATSAAGGTKNSSQQQDQKKRQILLRILGQVQMTRVFKVIAEIKLIQLGRDVTEGDPYAPISTCSKSGGCSFSVPCRGDQKAPKVVRDLFFNTAIVPAYEKTPPDHRFEKLPWNQLLAQGEARLAAYHEWYRQRQATKKFSSMTI